MPLLHETRSFLAYLQKHRDLRDRIKAGRDRTFLYAAMATRHLGGNGFPALGVSQAPAFLAV